MPDAPLTIFIESSMAALVVTMYGPHTTPSRPISKVEMHPPTKFTVRVGLARHEVSHYELSAALGLGTGSNHGGCLGSTARSGVSYAAADLCRVQALGGPWWR